MNMAGTFPESFAGARPVAQHCAELTERGPRPEERSEHVSAWCRDLAGELAQELGQLFSAGKLHVTVSDAEMLKGKDVFERIGPIAVNNLLRCGDSGQTALLSLDMATAIALTDCSFGGEGNPPDQVPSQLPRSAAMLVEQVAGMIAGVIVLSSGAGSSAHGDVLVRSESVARLKPFGAEAEVALFSITLAQGAFAEWNLLLAVANDKLDAILPGMGPRPATRSRSSQASDGTSGPFATMPMGLEAVLSELEMSLGQLDRLAPGDEIPLSIPRELPLRIGDQVLALGALGTLDNRMALRLTRLAGVAARQPAPEHSEHTPIDADNEGALA